MIETRMDPLAASFAAMEEAPHEDVAAEQEVAEAGPAPTETKAMKERPALAGGVREESRFVAAYLRRGIEPDFETKAFVGISDAAGGYAVPDEIDAVIDRTLASISPIRSIANVVKVGSAGYRKLVTTGGTPSGWVSEDAARPETDTPDFAEIAPPMGELYANPAASQAMLDDAAFDVEA